MPSGLQAVPLQGKAPKEIHAILREILSCFLLGLAKDLSAPLYNSPSHGAVTPSVPSGLQTVPLQGKAPKKIHAILREILSCFLPGLAKELSAPLYNPPSHGTLTPSVPSGLQAVPLQGKAPKEIHAILIETLACFLPVRAKDLLVTLYQHHHHHRQNTLLALRLLPQCKRNLRSLGILVVPRLRFMANSQSHIHGLCNRRRQPRTL